MLHVTVHCFLNAVRKERVCQCVVAISIDRVGCQFMQTQQAGQSAAGAIFMTSRIAQEDQRLFCRIVQPSGNLCLPEK